MTETKRGFVMKKGFLVLLLVFYSIYLYGYQAEDIYLTGWKTYTNTTHIHQILCKGDSVIAATWGGVNIFDKTNSTFSTLVKSDGLGKNDVRSIHYINDVNEYWFGTSVEGISRYQDGKFLKPYQENQGVDCDYINDIDDNDDFIFICTDQGLTMFENLEERIQFIKTFNAPRWLFNNYVNTINFDDSNRIWVGTNEGIDYAVIDYDSMLVVDGWWKHINNTTPGYPFGNTSITDIDFYNGRIYFGTEEGFGIVDNIYSDSLEFTKYTNYLPSQKVSSIKAANDSIVWIGSGMWDETNQTYDYANGIARYNILDPGESQIWNEQDSICDMISDIDIDDSGTIWVSSWGEDLYCFKDEMWYHYKRNCINSNIVAEMMLDDDNNLWCGFSRINLSPASKKGVSKFDGTIWTNYDISNSGLGNNTVYSLCQDNNGNMWFGHWGGSNNISVLNPSNNDWKIFKNINEDWLLCPAISFLLCDEDNNIWIGNYAAGPGGVTILKPDSSYVYFAPNMLYENEHADMLTMKKVDGKIWFGCYYTGIQYWDGPGFPQNDSTQYWDSFSGADGLSCYNFEVQGSGDYVDYFFAACVDGLYMYDFYWQQWFRYTNGLVEDVKMYRWNGIEWENYDYYWYDEEGNPESRMGSGKSSQVNQVYVDQHGRKWIATNGGGISMLDEDNYYFKNFTTENSSLPSDVVLSFAHNIYTGELFVGTAEGMCTFNIGAQINNGQGTGSIDDVVIYPDPFKPAEHSCIYFESRPYAKLPTGENMLYIYNLAGELVAELEESDHFRFIWDGKNSGKDVASGIYFFVLSSKSDKTYLNGKFAIIR